MNLAGPAHVVVDRILTYAAGHGVSDIHVEPTDETVRIRCRKDGVLFTLGDLPRDRLDALTVRIKVMAALDIANKRLPQDGRIAWRHGAETVDLRVSTMPTIRGEKTVIRLLDAGRVRLDLDALRLDGEAVTRLRRLIAATKGLLLICGPTGSGKTTTLYAALQERISPEIAVATLEDPVEYKIDGLSQSQIQPKQGLEFQNGLRALLRQDPDVMVVGEIRDSETARIAIQAALTGCLVLSTIHAANAAEVPVRLSDMGIEPYLVADALIGIVSQRLVRLLCTKCRVPVDRQGDRDGRPYVRDGVSPSHQNGGGGGYVHQGCEACLGKGYDGRMALCEVVPVGPAVKACIRSGGAERDFYDAAVADGAFTMGQAIENALQQGLTDRMEIDRVYDLGGASWM